MEYCELSPRFMPLIPCPKGYEPCTPLNEYTWLQWLALPEVIFFIVIGAIVLALFFASFLVGINSDWYNNLTISDENVWFARVGWVVATILSYVSYFFLRHQPANLYLRLADYYLINALLILLWSALLFQGQNLAAGVWMAVILFIYNFWLFLFVWSISPLAGIWLIPLVAMYAYLIWSNVHLAELNNVEL